MKFKFSLFKDLDSILKTNDMHNLLMKKKIGGLKQLIGGTAILSVNSRFYSVVPLRVTPVHGPPVEFIKIDLLSWFNRRFRWPLPLNH